MHFLPVEQTCKNVKVIDAYDFGCDGICVQCLLFSKINCIDLQ